MDPVWPVLSVSLQVTLITTVVVMALALALSVTLVRSRSVLAKAFEIVVYLPMAMPPVALGYGLLLLLGRNSHVGRWLHGAWGIDVSYTMLGAIVAAIAVSLGLAVRTVRVAIERIDYEQIIMARLIGATNWQIFWHIYLPQCRSAIFAAAVLVFIRALSEFGATMVLAGNTLGETRTLALAIWIGMEAPGQERQCLLFIIIAVFVSLIAVVSAEILLRRRGY